MQSYGTRGAGASNHREDWQNLLRGVLSDKLEMVVYPEDSCALCLREGKVKADESCFHRHWQRRQKRTD